MVNKAPKLIWSNESMFTVNGHQFITDLSWCDRRASDKDAYTIVKNQKYFDFYERIWNKNPKSIFEIGFFEGGSSVFFDQYFKPNSLTCVDKRAANIEAVTQYIDKENRAKQFRMVYGFDQGDVGGLTSLAEGYHDSKLDLVIDDASHQYELTKKSFSALFPFVKAGGHYVLEDYGWAHDARFQNADQVWAANPSMANLVFELTMIAAGSQGMIASIYADRAMCVIERGPEDFIGTFNPSDHYLARGNKLKLI